MSSLRWVLVQFRLFTPKNESGLSCLSLTRQLLQQGQQEGTLKSVTETGQLSLERTFASNYLRERLLDFDRLIGILLPAHTQTRVRMRPLHQAALKRIGYASKSTLTFIQKLLVFSASLLSHCAQTFREIHL
ncbi:hypothetical protein WT94_21905 [Burkholderia stagnalis]|nr:hypothetical protein WT76_00720 [Burkholderia stagnalis]KWO20729.1 hypothetical protein WT94_21905 [Burkholderia stagnalis]